MYWLRSASKSWSLVLAAFLTSLRRFGGSLPLGLYLYFLQCNFMTRASRTFLRRTWSWQPGGRVVSTQDGPEGQPTPSW